MVSHGSGQHLRNSKIPAHGAGTVISRLVGSVGVVLDRHGTALSGQSLTLLWYHEKSYVNSTMGSN